MNYKEHYDRLIDRARNRSIEGYVEVHHAVPKCMGGQHSRANLVSLTAEEHFVAHQLLCKMYPKHEGVAFALRLLTTHPNGRRVHNKEYGWIRRKLASMSSAIMIRFRENEAFQRKMRAAVGRAARERVWTAEQRAAVAAQRRAAAPRTFSAQARANMAAARLKTWAERRANGTVNLIALKTVATRRLNGSYSFSQEWRDNIGRAGRGRPSAMKGKTTLPEVRLKQSESRKRYVARTRAALSEAAA